MFTDFNKVINREMTAEEFMTKHGEKGEKYYNFRMRCAYKPRRYTFGSTVYYDRNGRIVARGEHVNQI